jgi:hypothetical protein
MMNNVNVFHFIVDATRTSESSLICKSHFEQKYLNQCSKLCRLTKDCAFCKLCSNHVLNIF